MTVATCAANLVLRSQVASLLMDLAEAVDHARGDEDGAAAVAAIRGDLAQAELRDGLAGRDPYEYLTALMQAHFAGQQLPSLLPQPAEE